MTSIEAKGLSKAFGDVVAVQDLSFRVDPGDIVGLLGANGAGKTTTMKMILGLLTPTAGEVQIGGVPAARVDRRVIGYVPQGLGIYRDLTVAENLEFAANAFGVPVPSPGDESLADVAHTRVSDISLGLQRRVAFLIARCHRPEVLILDEPTSGVGPLGRARLWETIHETAAEGVAVLVSTHYMEEAEECHRVVLMADGREVASGTVTDVIGDQRSVSLSGDVSDESLTAMSKAGGTVLLASDGWRVVGIGADEVRRLVRPDAIVDEVPASFEEAFVAFSR